jgi:probable phosphoglycerate mutase
MKRLFVVTHPEASHHLDGLVAGWFDSDLTHIGRQQADRIANRLQHLLLREDVEVFSSDLKRAVQTADAIAAKLAIKAEPLHDLREMSFGIAEGRPVSWLNARRVPPPDDQLDFAHAEGGETRREVAHRIYRAMDVILARSMENQIIVTHGYALTFVVAAWIGMPIEALGMVHFPVHGGSITRLESGSYWNNRGVLSLGDISHLAD